MCWLVACLYLFSAILQFVAIAFVYNLDKKTTALMTKELEARHASMKQEDSSTEEVSA